MDDVLQLVSVLRNLPLVALVLARVSGLILFVPFFSSDVVPAKMRILLALGLTLVVVPLVPGQMIPPANLGELVVGLGSELLVGLLFGFALNVLFTALEIAGLMAGQQMGIALAQVFDPLFDEENSVLGQLYFWLAMVIFLIVGGHISLIGAMVDSFRDLPAGGFVVSNDLVSLLLNILQTTYAVALRICAPVVVTILLTTVAIGFVARTVPQLNILSVGFPLKAMLGFVLTMVCLHTALQVFVTVLADLLPSLGSAVTLR